MSQELMAILEQIEREKGIKKEVLIEAVESALSSAVRKVIDIKPNEELKVEVERETGKIRAFRNAEEITSIDFGRIAASTARQVIIQKIREAEKEVVFNEFQARVGELVSGTVYRFEKGNLIVDLLGKAEGILLKREQSPSEEFRQGQRIRAYVVEVRKDSKGPQIVLSRTHPNMVKKLFELEVPEIYEGIVEIRSIARQPGERTKIAVWSKNEKVDSVGACVGMRGNRVRNIVTELQGEKIDIVRYNDDMREYIKAALSPAQISEIRLSKENLKAEVIVEDDQLSLAIGKHGQNVRLASKLIGWELDIRTKLMVAEQALQEAAKEQQAPEEAAVLPQRAQKRSKKEKGSQVLQAPTSEVEQPVVKEKKPAKDKKEKPQKQKIISFEELSGVGEKIMVALKAAGFKTTADLACATVEQLTVVKGIGKVRAAKLIKLARDLPVNNSV